MSSYNMAEYSHLSSCTELKLLIVMQVELGIRCFALGVDRTFEMVMEVAMSLVGVRSER